MKCPLVSLLLWHCVLGLWYWPHWKVVIERMQKISNLAVNFIYISTWPEFDVMITTGLCRWLCLLVLSMYMAPWNMANFRHTYYRKKVVGMLAESCWNLALAHKALRFWKISWGQLRRWTCSTTTSHTHFHHSSKKIFTHFSLSHFSCVQKIVMFKWLSCSIKHNNGFYKKLLQLIIMWAKCGL